MTSKEYFVYYYYDLTENKLVYVGLTNDFYKRHKEHYYDRNINRIEVNRFLQTTKNEVDIFLYGTFPDRGKALEIEQFLIKKHDPKYNVKGKRSL